MVNEVSRRFSIMTGCGDIFRVVERKQFRGQVVWYATEDGRKVRKNRDRTYSIPSLGAIGVDNRSVQ